MNLGIWEKIEHVRRQPEHIRMRYALGSLALSMLFILSIWFLSLHESFTIISKETPTVLEDRKNDIPNNDAPSLNDLMKEDNTLRVESGSQGSAGQDYFESQLEGKASQ